METILFTILILFVLYHGYTLVHFSTQIKNRDQLIKDLNDQLVDAIWRETLNEIEEHKHDPSGKKAAELFNEALDKTRRAPIKDVFDDPVPGVYKDNKGA